MSQASSILNRSATYQKIMAKDPERKILHQAIEKLLLWPKPELKVDPKEALEILESQNISLSKNELERYLKIYELLAEALPLGRTKRGILLDQQENKTVLSTLGCSKTNMLNILTEISRSFSEMPFQQEEVVPAPSSPPSPPLPQSPKPRREKVDSEEIARLKLELKESRQASGQQSLEIVRLNKEVGQFNIQLDKLQKENGALLKERDAKAKEAASLAKKAAELQAVIATLEARWLANVEVFERARGYIDFYIQMGYFFQELSQTLEIKDPATEENPSPESSLPQGKHRILSRMPREMKTNSQRIEPGPGLADSLERLSPLLTDKEEEEILEALICFSKKSRNHPQLTTQRRGISTDFSPAGVNLTGKIKSKVGFTWSASKLEGKPIIVIYEIVRS